MTTNANDLSVINKIHSAPADMSVRLNLGMIPGNVAHQGDLYIVMLSKEPNAARFHKDASKYVKSINNNPPLGPSTSVRQLALGDTVGSKHIAVASHFTNAHNLNESEDEGVKDTYKHKGLIIYARTKDHNPLTGPTIEAHGEWTLTHPEHAHHVFPKGTYIAIYQRDFAAEQMAAVRD